MRVYVLADSQQQFSDWCARQRVNQAAATCVLDPFSLRGQIESDDQVIDVRSEKTSPRESRALANFEEAAALHRLAWRQTYGRAFDPSG